MDGPRQSHTREMRKERLKVLVMENSNLPIEKRRSKFDLLIDAGYSEDAAKSLCGVLVENGEQRVIPVRGVDTDSSKLVLQELMHDPLVKDEVRLKAAEDALKLTGALRDPENGDKTSQILAGILRDIASEGRKRTRLYEEEKELQGGN